MIEVRIQEPEGGDVPQTWYFTFGVGDPVNAGCYVVFREVTFFEARERMVECFGTAWAFQYDEAGWHRDGIPQNVRWCMREIEPLS